MSSKTNSQMHSKTSSKNGKPDVTRSLSNEEDFCLAINADNQDHVDKKTYFKFVRKHHLHSKLFYMMTVSAIVFLSYSTLAAPRFIPYIYAIVTPVLLFIRIFLYWRLKYQYFLLDFCYFANIFIYVFIWAFPKNENVFMMAYAIATGPLLWSILVFRNSLVFHSLDKVTSLYIHTLPPIMLYVIRWYPKETSQLWYTEFPEYETNFSVKWLIVIPFAFPVLHQIVYGVLVYSILRPSEDYLYTYNYIVGTEVTSRPYRISHFFGARFRHVVFGSAWLLIIFGMLCFNLLWFNYFAGNCAVLVFFNLVAVYNGATFYLDVFSVGTKCKDTEESCSAPTDKCNTCRSSCETNSNGLKVYSAVVKLSPESCNFASKPV